MGFSVAGSIVSYDDSPGLRLYLFHSVTFFHAVFDGFQLVEVGAGFLVYDDLFLVESCFHLKVDDEASGFAQVEVVFKVQDEVAVGVPFQVPPL